MTDRPLVWKQIEWGLAVGSLGDQWWRFRRSNQWSRLCCIKEAYKGKLNGLIRIDEYYTM